jgi:hypothetical protein
VTAAVVRMRGSSHTAIRVSVGPKFTTFIPMETLALTKLDNREFHNDWEEYTVYPVRRAAQLYLKDQFREIPQQARECLEKIVADPATVFDETRINQPSKEETTMATATKTAPAKKAPATSKVAAAPAKPAAKAAPAKPAAAPAKPAAKAAPTKPAAKAPAKANGISTVVAQAGKKAPAKNAAPAAKVPPVRPANDEKLKVDEPEKARRGTTAEFVAEAVKLKTFTRQQLHDVMVKKGHESKAARIKIADCVYFKVFVPA